MTRQRWWPRTLMGAVGCLPPAGACPAPSSRPPTAARGGANGGTTGSDDRARRCAGRRRCASGAGAGAAPDGRGRCRRRRRLDDDADAAGDGGRESSLHDAATARPPTRTPDDAPRMPRRPRAPRPGELAIDELLVNPTGDDLGREWIELANRSAEPLDLSALHLANGVDRRRGGGRRDRRRGAPRARTVDRSGEERRRAGRVAYGTKLILLNANGQRLDLSRRLRVRPRARHRLVGDAGRRPDGACPDRRSGDQGDSARPRRRSGPAAALGRRASPNPPCVENARRRGGRSRRCADVSPRSQTRAFRAPPPAPAS